MQKPIRYYITKSGEEPTVRSVEVALGVRKLDADVEPVAVPAELTVPTKHVASSAREVKQRVKNAIRGRTADR